ADDRAGRVLCRRDGSVLLLNSYPYTPGQLTAVMNRHVGTLVDATTEEVGDAIELVQFAVQILTAEYRAEGFNIGLNQGRVAGAGIADHLHVHAVPRWHGDTNFMPVLGEVRVIPEALAATYHRPRGRGAGSRRQS